MYYSLKGERGNCFHTWALLKDLVSWYKSPSPPEMQQTTCNTDREPFLAVCAEVQFFRIVPQSDPRDAVLHNGQWFGNSDSAFFIFWRLMNFIVILQIYFIWNRWLERNNQFAAVENNFHVSVRNLVSNQMMSFLLCFVFLMEGLQGDIRTIELFPSIALGWGTRDTCKYVCGGN